ncbi:rubredoxin [Methanoregula sp.]|uniref:rubredoxin n=1 Tax=Methanoregula sp. TaxID=2052170 RepID=UPI003C712FBE
MLILRVRYVCSICGHVYDPEKGESSWKFPGNRFFRNFPVTSRAVYVLHQKINSAGMADGNGIT